MWAAAAERIDTIELSVIPFLVDIRSDVKAAADQLAKVASLPRSIVEASPAALLGPPSKLIDDLLARRERWAFSYIVLSSHGHENVRSRCGETCRQ